MLHKESIVVCSEIHTKHKAELQYKSRMYNCWTLSVVVHTVLTEHWKVTFRIHSSEKRYIFKNIMFVFHNNIQLYVY